MSQLWIQITVLKTDLNGYTYRSKYIYIYIYIYIYVLYRSLKSGDYFGEMALMLNEMRHANCIAGKRYLCIYVHFLIFVCIGIILLLLILLLLIII
jgi:CRP-like cAMP-binding protein